MSLRVHTLKIRRRLCPLLPVQLQRRNGGDSSQRGGGLNIGINTIWQNADPSPRTGHRANSFILSASSAPHKVTIDPGLRQAEAESAAWPRGESCLMIRRLTSHSPTVFGPASSPNHEWNDSFRCFHVTGLVAVGLRWQTTLRGFPSETWVQVEGRDLGQSAAKWQTPK